MTLVLAPVQVTSLTIDQELNVTSLVFTNSVAAGSGETLLAAGTTVAEFETDGDILFGPNVGLDTANDHSDNSACPIDFWWDLGHRRLHTRTILLTENGDPPELALRRSDGTYPDGAAAAIGASANLGLIHWTGWTSGSPGSFQSRSAQIYARSAEAITAAAAGGHLYFATTPAGTAAGTIDRLTIRADGAVLIVSGNLSESQGDAIGGRGDLVVGGAVYATGTITARKDPANGASTTQVMIGNVGPGSEAGISFDSTPQARFYLASSSFLKTEGDLEVRALRTTSGGGLTLADANDVTIAATTGSKIGQATSKIAFFGATPIVKPTVSGSRGGNAALASALTALANLGLVTDSSTA